jgi:DNA-directed RNA polymerase alpha subunit
MASYAGIIFVSIVVLVVAGIIAYNRYKDVPEDETPTVPSDDHTEDIGEKPREIPEDFVSSECVTHLKNANVRTLCHLRKLDKEDLLNIDYIGKKRAERIMEEVNALDEQDFFRSRNR